MTKCRHCAGPTEYSFRYCPWCAAPQRVKLVEFFRAHPLSPNDQAKALRVSRYVGVSDEERQVRLSIWTESGESASADAAMSLDEGEAARLARFLADPAHPAGEAEPTSLRPGI